MPDIVRSAPGRVVRRGSERGPVREFLTFKLGDDLYGVELTRIKEILSPPPITQVPRATPDVLGVCSVRGLLVTVVDLRRRLRLEARPFQRRTRILLVTADWGEVMGLLVDEVRQVVRLQESEVEMAASALGGDVAEYVLGVGRPQDSFIVLLDLRAIVSEHT